MTYLNHWIPAFAGMTEEAKCRNLSGMAKGLPDGNKPISIPIVIPAKAGIQEGGPQQ